MPYTGQDWRLPKWQEIKRRALERIYGELDDHIEDLANEVLGAYMDSEEFGSDAQCRGEATSVRRTGRAAVSNTGNDLSTQYRVGIEAMRW